MFDDNNSYKHAFLIDPVFLGIDFIEENDLFDEYFNIMNYTFNETSKIINSKLNETLNTFPVELLENYDNDKDFEYFNELLKPFYNEITDDLQFFNNISLKNIKDKPDEISLCMSLEEPIIICKTYKSLDVYKSGKVVDLDIDGLKVPESTFSQVQYFLEKLDQCNIYINHLVIWDPRIPIATYYIDN